MKRLFGVLVVLVIGINCFGQGDNTNIDLGGDLYDLYISDTLLSSIIYIDTLFITPCESEWVRIGKYEWYNKCEWSFIDSSWYYNTIEVIVNEYERYSVECYNDSVLDYYYYEFCDGGCYKVPCDKNENFWSIMPCKGIWTHKQPTFEGFMNRLKTKMEEYPW